MTLVKSVEDDIELLDRAIKASEDWSTSYAKDPDSHAGLIKAEARLERKLRAYLRDLADRSDSLIRWYNYRAQVQADYDVQVIVDDSALDKENDVLFTVIFEDVALATAFGADAGEVIYKFPLGLDKTSAVIQRTAREHVARLVGKKVLDTGQVVDNIDSQYQLTDALRNDIRESIKTSLSLGEDITAAQERVRQTIANPKRATLIAQTESVNGYQGGLYTFGQESGAIGKEWQDLGAIDQCGLFASLGPVPLDYDYGDGITKPTAHPRCRCGLRLLYPGDPEAANITGE